MDHQLKSLTRLSLAGFALYSPISILAFPVSLLVVNPDASPIQLLLLGFLLTFLTYLFYFPFVKLQSRIRFRPGALAMSFFVFVISATGAFRGALFYLLDIQFEYEQPSSFLIGSWLRC